MLSNTTNYLLPKGCSVAQDYVKIDVSLKNMLVKAFSRGIWSSNKNRVRPAARAALIARFTEADVRCLHNACLSKWLSFICVFFLPRKKEVMTGYEVLTILLTNEAYLSIKLSI